MPLKILHIEDLCTGCGACASICPKQALSMQEDKLGFYTPILDKEKCINCHLCEKACHAINLPMPSVPSLDFRPLMVKAKDHDVVMKSSSGGVFSLLANWALNIDGVVYGGSYDYEKQRLAHISTDDCDLDKLRKSKYIESYTGKIFSQVDSNLKDNRTVVFVGTPCQIDGLIRFLEVKRTDTTKLLLVRFVCHGVPSNSFFRQYKCYEEKTHHSPIIDFDFRPKFDGWGAPTWYVKFKNGKEIKDLSYYYYYYRAFYDNISLRKSCYICKRVFDNRADLTIADFWGLKRLRPESNEREGVSLVLSHSVKGDKALNDIKNECLMEDIPFSSIEYIFTEAEHHNKYREAADVYQEKVLKNDGQYMPVTYKIYRSSIIKLKIRNFLCKTLKPVIKWVKR